MPTPLPPPPPPPPPPPTGRIVVPTESCSRYISDKLLNPSCNVKPFPLTPEAFPVRLIYVRSDLRIGRMFVGNPNRTSGEKCGTSEEMCVTSGEMCCTSGTKLATLLGHFLRT